MKLTANITLDELTKSQTAERKGINNNPSAEQIEKLKVLSGVKKFPTRIKCATMSWHAIRSALEE